MTVVDVEHEVYRCPHCPGYIVVREQFPHYDAGCSISLEHYTVLPDWLKKEAGNVVQDITVV